MTSRPLAILLLLLLLAACGGQPPAPGDPALSALLAQATTDAYATRQAEAAAQATATYSALLAAQQSTRESIVAQQTAVAQATLQSAAATQTSVAAGQQTRQAVAVAAVTGTAVAMSTQEIRDGILTVEAGQYQRQASSIALRATETRLGLEAERDREAAARGRWWAGLAFLFVAVLAGVSLLLLYSLAARRLAEARVVRDGRGNAVAFWIGRGMWEPVTEAPPPPALPAPVEMTPAPDIVRVNGARRERLYQYDDDVALHWRDMAAVFTQEQVRELRRWYQAGHTRIRRDTSSAGPGMDRLPDGGLGSGSVYNTTRAVLLGLEYITEDGSWTPRGVVEFLGLDYVG